MDYKKISGFSDEISEDVKKQFEVLNKLGIEYFEVRGVDGKNISKLTDEELFGLKALMDEYGIQVSSIGSPIGKIKVDEDFESHFEVYKNIVKTAKILGTKYIRVFSFYHEPNTEWTKEERDEVFRRLKVMVDYAKEEDVILLHENEKHIYGDIAERCLELMQEFSCANFKAVFDPANFVQCKVDTKKAYEMLKSYIAYMHIKDALLSDETVVPAGMGDGNIEYILRDLFDSGYDGFLSLEPHLGKFKGFAALEMGIADETLPSDYRREKRFTLAHNSLKEILEKI